MPKIPPNECLHKTIHPARFDGTHTVCFDCEQQVMVISSFYESGVPFETQYKDAIERLNWIRTKELREELAKLPQNTKSGA